tara:strand:- start:452 stop:688 length:237 start_codon:yes stop_codon:yes gene_type:complete
MHSEYNFDEELSVDTDRMVYVKSVLVSDLPSEVQKQVDGVKKLFAVHDADGKQLALVGNRHLAFALARQHDYSPQPLH